MKKKEQQNLMLRDYLAIDRTHLANERTFLAYFRSFLVFASTGVAILQLDVLSEIIYLGWVLISISPIFLILGLYNFVRMKKKIKGYYFQSEG